MGVNKGIGAIGSLTSENNGGGGNNDAEITPFKSGDTIKVAVKSAQDLAQYFNYGVYKKVNSFVPKNPATRNAKGFVESNPSPWDQASQYYYDQAKNAEDGDQEEALKKEGYKYKGKEKFLMGFHDLTAGKDIVVDLTKNQALSVYETIKEYSELDSNGMPVEGGDHDFKEMAFKLSKKGESTSTTATLNPIVNPKKGLTDEENSNFEAVEFGTFNSSLFDDVLYEMDEKNQIEALRTAGFDVSLIGLEVQAGEGNAQNSDESGPIDISDDDLPF